MPWVSWPSSPRSCGPPRCTRIASSPASAMGGRSACLVPSGAEVLEVLVVERGLAELQEAAHADGPAIHPDVEHGVPVGVRDRAVVAVPDREDVVPLV